MKNSAHATANTGREVKVLEGRRKEGFVMWSAVWPSQRMCLGHCTIQYTLLLTLVNPNFNISVLHETVAHRNVLWMMDWFRARAIVSNWELVTVLCTVHHVNWRKLLGWTMLISRQQQLQQCIHHENSKPWAYFMAIKWRFYGAKIAICYE